MASTVLHNGIIIPEKYSRDWYNDLYHNWQELDNLLGGGTPKDGTLTIQKNGTTVGTFSANQATDETINIEVPTKTSDLNNDSGFITGVSWNDVADKPSFATVATSGSYNDLSNKPTIPTVNNATLTIQKNGTNVQTFTANQSTNATANITVPTKTSDLTNDSGFITSDDTKIPLAGSNQISGSLIPAGDNSIDIGSSINRIKSVYTHKIVTADELSLVHTDDIGTVIISGGADSTSACLVLMGKNYSYLNRNGNFFLGASDDTNSCDLQGVPNGTLIWGGQPIQYGSDARLKQQISEIDDKLLDAWEDVEPSQFKYNDAVEQKGKDKARLHTGFVVQQIDKACQSHGVDISAYGLYCHEEYPQEVEEVEVEQADGTKTKERKVIREASEHYSLRYTEALVVECKYLRRCVARLTARIEELEKGNKEIEK